MSELAAFNPEKPHFTTVEGTIPSDIISKKIVLFREHNHQISYIFGDYC